MSMKRCRARVQPKRTLSMRTFYGAEAVFFGVAHARSLSSEVKMNSNTPHTEPPDPHSATQNNGRRHVRDGGVAVFLLAVAVFAGYVALHADTLRAKTVNPTASTPRETSVASVGTPELSGASATPPAPPSAEMPQTAPAPAPPRPTWAGAINGRVLGPDRQPALGASVVHAGTEVQVDAEGAFTLAATDDVP